MRVPDEAVWVAEYWDDILRDFGIEVYVQLRYMESEVKKDEKVPHVTCGVCGVADNRWFQHRHGDAL